MALEQWALPQLSTLLPLDQSELKQIISYTDTLSDPEAAVHLRELLGDSPEALQFISDFNSHRSDLNWGMAKTSISGKSGEYVAPPFPPQATSSTSDSPDAKAQMNGYDEKSQPPAYVAPPGPPPNGTSNNASSKSSANGHSEKARPGTYAPPSGPAPTSGSSRAASRNHTNPVIEAAKIRAVDEQEMQQALQNLQYQYQIYNSDIEPEHETDYYCNCAIHLYQRRKWNRYGVQKKWSEAVMYPGEKSYNDNNYSPGAGVFTNNPYRWRVMSPYGYGRSSMWGPMRPVPSYHAQSIHQTIKLNNALNQEAVAKVEAKEPRYDIWDDTISSAMGSMSLNEKKKSVAAPPDRDSKRGSIMPSNEKRQSVAISSSGPAEGEKKSRFSSFKKSIGMKSTEEKAAELGQNLRESILQEERGRWPDDEWRNLVYAYQEKVGMSRKIAELRARSPIQYLHLLRAGYFEPIPVAWASQNSNPLKFSIEAAAGWRGITPAWRGYEDTAEERLYWVLNHREGSIGMRMKPDYISEMNMARDRMARAVEPPPEYFSATDTCHVQHTSAGYSKQVMPPPFRAFDRPEVATDDTMILLDVSGSMDFDPLRPVYDQYMITGYAPSTQPKNKAVAKAIIRRFTEAMAHHDHSFSGYDLTTFSTQAQYIGTINHQNFDQMYRNVRIGGGTRVMTGWQKVKELHFQKHSESATHHPIYGWQAGPETPMLRLLLLLDGEATDMDEFELDLLALSWAHVTIFLIGVDGCPHHHRHANELQRIGDVNHHVSFVDAQGNCPERFVTHELLKRHLGYAVSMQEFEEMEELPAYAP